MARQAAAKSGGGLSATGLLMSAVLLALLWCGFIVYSLNVGETHDRHDKKDHFAEGIDKLFEPAFRPELKLHHRKPPPERRHLSSYTAHVVRHSELHAEEAGAPEPQADDPDKHLPDVVLPDLKRVDENYPVYDDLYDVVTNWNPDDPDGVPVPFYEKLQVFNFSDPEQQAMAAEYRDREVPFKVFGVPNVDEVVRKWTDDYLKEKMNSRGVQLHVEESRNNHFMYYTNKPMGRGRMGEWTPPTKRINLKFNDWLKEAYAADAHSLANGSVHHYLTIGTNPARKHGHYVSDDLTIFSTEVENFFIRNVAANKGIQCRFGERGIIAESHYDSGRNFIAMLRGAKRYILNPPEACARLGIIPDRAHPSFRHSDLDWSDTATAAAHFKGVPAIDTVVREGEVLYVPSFVFHEPISLGLSIQCNSRGGTPPKEEGKSHIEKCLGVKLDFSKYNKMTGDRKGLRGKQHK